MKAKFILFLVVAVALAGCRSDRGVGTEYVEYSDDVQYISGQSDNGNMPCASDAGTSTIKYSVAQNGDLTLETRHHVINVNGAPSGSYAYYVWAGDKTYNDAPDLIVEDNTIMTLDTAPAVDKSATK